MWLGTFNIFLDFFWIQTGEEMVWNYLLCDLRSSFYLCQPKYHYTTFLGIMKVALGHFIKHKTLIWEKWNMSKKYMKNSYESADEDHECAYLANPPVHSATHVGRHRPHFPFINAKSIWMHISCVNFLLRTTYHHVEGVHTKVHWNRVCAEQIFWPEIGQFAREDGIGLDQKA